MEATSRFPYAVVSIDPTGPSGNAFSVIGLTRHALIRAGATKAELDEYMEAATAGDYNHLLAVTREWVTLLATEDD
jgi:hypothetical protein